MEEKTISICLSLAQADALQKHLKNFADNIESKAVAEVSAVSGFYI